MTKIKEIKISIHRKYTKNYQSYGFRIGAMIDIEEDPEVEFEELIKFLEVKTRQENNKIYAIWEAES